MAEELVEVTIDRRGVATATLNRPEVGNAYNEEMLTTLIGGLERLAVEPAVRCLVVRGRGGISRQAPTSIGWARSRITRRIVRMRRRWRQRGRASVSMSFRNRPSR